MSGLLRRLSDRLEAYNNKVRRKYGLPEDHRPSQYREKKLREREEKRP